MLNSTRSTRIELLVFAFIFVVSVAIERHAADYERSEIGRTMNDAQRRERAQALKRRLRGAG